MANNDEIYGKVCELLKPYNPENRPILMQSGIVSDLEVENWSTRYSG